MKLGPTGKGQTLGQVSRRRCRAGVHSLRPGQRDEEDEEDCLRTGWRSGKRYETGFDQDVKLAMQRRAPMKLSGATTAVDAWSWFTRAGDMGAILMGGWAVYRHHERAARKAGKSAEEARRIGIEAMERSSERSQQAGNVKDLGAFQRTGSFGKLFSMFQTAPIAYYRLWSAAVRNLAAKRGTKQEHVKRLLLTQFLLPMPFQFVADGLRFGASDDDDPEDRLIPFLPKSQLRAMALGPFNGLLIANDVLDMLIRGLQGEHIFGDAGGALLPPADSANDMVKVARRLHNMAEEVTVDDVLSVLEDTAAALGKLAGVPTEPALRLATGLADVATGATDSPVRRALGFSPFVLGDSGRASTPPARGRARVPRPVRAGR